MKATYLTSGNFKGRQLSVASGMRPTQERVRKALMDVLQEVIVGSVFLELFAGSGAVGLEALSNGAGEVVFVEKNIRSLHAIKSNLIALGSTKDTQRVSLLSTDVFKAITKFESNNKQFDIIFLDPPYYGDLAKNTLQRLSACDIVMPHCVIVVEHNKKDHLEETINTITCFKQKRYGDTMLSFYKKMSV